MNLDDFKAPWQQRQRELDQKKAPILERVRSRMSWVDQVILRRDMRESVVALMLCAWYGYDFFQHPALLAKLGCLLTVLACLMIVVILNWARLTGRIGRPDQPLQEYCDSESARIDRQIWLLRHVNWWYTGPIFVSVTIAMLGSQPFPQTTAFAVTMLLPIGWFIHWLNQQAVASELIPLKRELASVLDASQDESALVESTFQPSFGWKKPNPWRITFLVIGWIVLIALGGFLAEKFDSRQEYPKLSPFTDIRFDDDQVFVTYENQEYEWLAIDGIRVPQVVESAKYEFDSRWQKRIAEDLVEVLGAMDHPTGESVSLELFDLEIKQAIHIEDAPMTNENRNQIYRKRW